jgi:hypothetical protein
MHDPAYYRDLIEKLLCEDDDIPNPPSRKDIKKNQFLRWLHGADTGHSLSFNTNFWRDFLDTDIAGSGYDSGYVLNLPLRDNVLKVWFDKVSNGIVVSHDMLLKVSKPSDPVELARIEWDGDVDALDEWQDRVGKEIKMWMPAEIQEKYGVASKLDLYHWDDENYYTFIIRNYSLANWIKEQLEPAESFLQDKDSFYQLKHELDMKF